MKISVSTVCYRIVTFRGTCIDISSPSLFLRRCTMNLFGALSLKSRSSSMRICAQFRKVSLRCQRSKESLLKTAYSQLSYDAGIAMSSVEIR
jgi:hypothetical protein